MARIYYFRAFFDLALTYFRIIKSQVRLLSQIILTSYVQHDYPMTQSLRSFRASVEIVCNPCESSPSSTIRVPLWFIIISLMIFYLCKVFFLDFLQFNGNFVHA